MLLQHTLIKDAMAQALEQIAIIEAHAGQLGECEALAERINDVAPRLEGKPCAHISLDDNSLTTRVLIVAARESELRAALRSADLQAAHVEHGCPVGNSMRIHLAGGLRTVIDVIVKVDEVAAAIPMAA